MQEEIQSVVDCMSLANFESYLTSFIEYLTAHNSIYSCGQIKEYARLLNLYVLEHISKYSKDYDGSLIQENLNKTLWALKPFMS